MTSFINSGGFVPVPVQQQQQQQQQQPIFINEQSTIPTTTTIVPSTVQQQQQQQPSTMTKKKKEEDMMKPVETRVMNEEFVNESRMTGMINNGSQFMIVNRKSFNLDPVCPFFHPFSTSS